MARPVGSKGRPSEENKAAWQSLLEKVNDISPWAAENRHDPTQASRRALVFLRLTNTSVENVAKIVGMSVDTLYRYYGEELRLCQGVFRGELLAYSFERAYKSDAILGKMLDMFVAPHIEKPKEETLPQQAFVDAPKQETREEWTIRRRKSDGS